MSRITLITLIICSVCILGMGLGNVSWGQCRHSVSTSDLAWPYGPYNSCDSYVYNVFSGTVGTTGGHTTIVCVFQAPGQEYEHYAYAGNLGIGDKSLGWWNPEPVESTTGHYISVGIIPDVPGSKDNVWLDGTWKYTVEYFAAQQQ